MWDDSKAFMRVRYERSFFNRPVFQFPYKKLCIFKDKGEISKI